MPQLDFSVATFTGTKTFTASQAETFIPPLLRRWGWPGETVWSAMNDTERQQVCDFIVSRLVYEAATLARRQSRKEGEEVGGDNTVQTYDTAIGTLILPPSVP